MQQEHIVQRKKNAEFDKIKAPHYIGQYKPRRSQKLKIELESESNFEVDMQAIVKQPNTTQNRKGLTPKSKAPVLTLCDDMNAAQI
jgi:hypothetical protein